MGGELFILLAYAAAGLVDLLLLPFLPLMPQTFYVGTAKVAATRVEPVAAPVAIGHYQVQPPGSRDWFRIEPPAQTMVDPGAILLFVRKPTSRRPFLTVKLDDAGRTVMGKTEPAAFVRIETLPGGDDPRRQLKEACENRRTLVSASMSESGNYQVERESQAFLESGGVLCLRDDFVSLLRDDLQRKGGVSRHVELSMLCADPACPGRAIRLVFRTSGTGTDQAEREAQSFLTPAAIDAGSAPACGTTR